MNCTKLQELAAAQALGALDGADAVKLEAWCARNPDAQSEVASFHEVVAALALGLPAPIQPPPELRAKVLERVRQQFQETPVEAAPVVPHGFQWVLKDDAGWQTTPLPGFRVKPLSVSRDMGYRVVLVELAPGTRFPEHDHDSSEELFILTGHLHTEGRILGPGDFLHAEPGTHHRELVSPDGCTALLIDRAPAAV